MRTTGWIVAAAAVLALSTASAYASPVMFPEYELSGTRVNPPDAQSAFRVNPHDRLSARRAATEEYDETPRVVDVAGNTKTRRVAPAEVLSAERASVIPPAERRRAYLEEEMSAHRTRTWDEPSARRVNVSDKVSASYPTPR